MLRQLGPILGCHTAPSIVAPLWLNKQSSIVVAYVSDHEAVDYLIHEGQVLRTTLLQCIIDASEREVGSTKEIVKNLTRAPEEKK